MKKICPICNTEQSLRKRVCECEYVFYESKKYTKRIVKDWTALNPGDKIKVSGGSYFLSKTGKKIPMGHRGQFTVTDLSKDCIIASSGLGSVQIIYMGQVYYCDKLSIYREPHKVFKLK